MAAGGFRNRFWDSEWIVGWRTIQVVEAGELCEILILWDQPPTKSLRSARRGPNHPEKDRKVSVVLPGLGARESRPSCTRRRQRAGCPRSQRHRRSGHRFVPTEQVDSLRLARLSNRGGA